MDLFELVSKQNDRLCLRLAKESDYDNVIHMSRDLFNGHDYMPAMFLEQCKDPNIRILIVDLIKENGTKAIGLFAGKYAPQDKSLNTYALRIDGDYRNRGISSAIKPLCYEYWTKEFQPRYLYEIRPFIASWDTEVIYNMKPEVACNWYYMCFSSNPKDILSKAQKEYTAGTELLFTEKCEQVSIQQLCAFLSQNSYNKKVLLDRCRFPLEVKEVNVKFMMGSSRIFLTKDHYGQLLAASFGYVKYKPDPKCIELAISYYSNSEDEFMVKKHICSQLISASFDIAEYQSLNVNVIIPFHLNYQSVSYCLLDVLGHCCDMPPPYDVQSIVLAKYTANYE